MGSRETTDSTMSKGLDIAIVGLSARLPGARNASEFWQNLREGVESISFFSDPELEAAGVDPAMLRDPNYVRAAAILEDVELFDASFFGFYPREAELMDPQHRLFLECAWEAIEDAGCNLEKYDGVVGVYAGVGISTYLVNNILSHQEMAESSDPYQFVIQNDKDFLATRVSYKLNLKGPSVVVQTACSTSLVAVHLACQGLLNYQCDLALSGGVAIRVPGKRGYLYQEGGVASPDGHCRSFDAAARGTVGGSGVGIVVLKRLEDALADGDCIHAVIKGSAINNDGSSKVGFTAPSVDGQAEVIEAAQAIAQVGAGTIGYVETHGTGTVLGDPIEIAALTQAFRASTDEKGFCAIGSVKTNIGHLDAAAGVAGLIKTVLALKHKMLPPSLNFARPNPNINFAESPFYVNSTLAAWKSSGAPRRAGVSSFGMGGTNAHVILEEAPAEEAAGVSRSWQLLLLSAKTGPALETATSNLVTHLKQHPDVNLADVAFTLQTGRQAFSHRRMVVCREIAQATSRLEARDPQQVFTAIREKEQPYIVFMFPGQGTQYVNMGLGLYRAEPIFRQQVDLCSELLKAHLGVDLRDVLFPGDAEAEEAARKLNQTAITQPALFVIEYATAKLWNKWGIRPQAMIGHSIGEYVAACLAGVISLKDALRIVALRGRLMQELPAGAMLAVPLPQAEVLPLLGEGLSLAAVNGPSNCVVSGRAEAVDELQRQLASDNLAGRLLRTSHAFHSMMMEPVRLPFTEQVRKLDLQPPRIPYMSNLSGTWITAAEATDPDYWAQHLCQTVSFSQGIGELMTTANCVLLEVGPGQALSALARQHLKSDMECVILPSLRHPHQTQPDEAFLLTTLGKLWLAGLEVSWPGFYVTERRHRVALPTYPFERERYWIEPRARTQGAQPRRATLCRKQDPSDWFYAPLWKQTIPLLHASQRNLADNKQCWLVFNDEHELGTDIVERLRQQGQVVITVPKGESFTSVSDQAYTVNPRRRDDYENLLRELQTRGMMPDVVLHLWGVTTRSDARPWPELFDESQDSGFYSLIFLAQALGKLDSGKALQLYVVSNSAQPVTGEESLSVEQATILGPCKVIPQEYPNITCRSIDLVLAESGTRQHGMLVDQIIAEVTAKSPDLVVAYRGNHRWAQTYEPIRPDARAGSGVRLRSGGVYLITGGLGNIGLQIAEYLAQTVQAKLILVGRSTLPSRDDWDRWLARHDNGHQVSKKIGRVRELERLGAEVVVASADVADPGQMQVVMDQACERFGGINGVVHAAGMVGEEWLTTISRTDRRDCESHFRPKVHGLLALEELLWGRELDFCLLFSSLSSVLGGPGYVAYASANLFMDAFAQRQNMTGPTPWISVDWDGWQDVEEATPVTNSETGLIPLAMTPRDGVEAFERVLSLVGTSAQIVVSVADLPERINQWVKRERLPGREPSKNLGGPLALHPRPSLQNVYVAPGNELEQQVGEIWKETLGIEQVGIHDSFFELGGDSLLATQLIPRLRGAFQVEIPLRSFFESPTVAGLVSVITDLKGEQDAGTEAEILKMLEQFSEDEIEAELNKRLQVAKEESA